VWGSLEPLDARTFFAAQQINPEITGQARVRYNADTARIEASWRIEHEGKTYAITAPPLNPDMRDRELTMLIQEMPVRASTRN
jgi:SPP1 family predicted phage head-tail adaptor